MDEAELLASAQVEQIGENAGPLRTVAVLKMLTTLGQEEVLVVRRIAPVWLGFTGSWRRSRCRGRWWRAGKSLIEAVGRCTHARGRRTSGRTRVRHLHRGRVEGQVLTAEGATSPVREAKRAVIPSHSRRRD